MIQNTLLFDNGVHKYYFLGWEEKQEEIIQTNQYLIVDGNEAILLDPGGAHVFPRVLANVSEIIEPSKITHIFYTHQDPDVTSGIILWLSIAENSKVYISNLWTRFLPHFGVYDKRRVVGIPDHGDTIKFKSGNTLELIPAHYLHSTGNFTLYDPVAKILFSGDIGACVFPEGKKYRDTENFDSHVKNLELFHKRYMTSNIACRKWVDIVGKKQIEMITPQHGAVMKKECAKRFLEWLKDLKCGVDLIDQFYGK
nr:MBL fold metallo-hydrolase [Thermotoga profunda]